MLNIQTISNLKIIIFAILFFLATNVSSKETVSSGCKFKAETEENSQLIEMALGSEAEKCVTFPYLSKYTKPEPVMPLFHAGVDLQANNQAVSSVTNGKVMSACEAEPSKTACKDSMGIIMIATRVKGVESRVIYVHMSQSLVKVGDTVEIGQPLGTSGNRFGGNPNGAGVPHLHIEVRPNYSGLSAVGRVSCGGPETCVTKDSVAAITFDPAEIIDSYKSEPASNTNIKSSKWVFKDQANFELKLGETKSNFKFNNTGEVTFGGKMLFPKFKRIDAYTLLKVYISPSNPSKALVAFRDWDYGVLRAAIVDLNNKTIISNQLIPESSVRGVGRENILTISDTAFSWSPDGQFVAMAISPGEFQLNLAVVNLYSGKINQHWPTKLSKLKEDEAYSPDMQSIKWIWNKSLQFNFDHFIYKDNEGHVKDYSSTETIANTDLPSNFKINQGGGSKDKPFSTPNSYQHWGACPFECCVYREWIAMEPSKLYQTRDEHSKVVANLIKNETVLAITGVVVTHKVGKAKILLPIQAWENSKSNSPNELTINKGEIIYPLHYEGEGYSAFWYNGKVYSAELINTKQVNIEQEYQYDWWAQIKNKSGKVGWTKQTNVFAQQDACG